MLMENQWSFTGTTGKQYTFAVFSKSALLPHAGGIYILAYAHPRGHLAGFQVTPLTMGATDDLQRAVAALQQHEYLVRECWNYTFILTLDDMEQRDELMNDLSDAYRLCC
jgi:hypothetical protein